MQHKDLISLERKFSFLQICRDSFSLAVNISPTYGPEYYRLSIITIQIWYKITKLNFKRKWYVQKLFKKVKVKCFKREWFLLFRRVIIFIIVDMLFIFLKHFIWENVLDANYFYTLRIKQKFLDWLERKLELIFLTEFFVYQVWLIFVVYQAI